ncbi:MAG: 3'-5' exonuclease [archaeon]
MIVVDIETSGGDYEKCGIWQIGAVDLDNPENTFLEEARLEDEYEIVGAINMDSPRPVLEVIGKTEEELRDKNKQSEKELIKNFLRWCESVKVRNLICHHPQFDYSFIYFKAIKYGLKPTFFHRALDIQSIAHAKYAEIHGKLLIKGDHIGLGLKEVLALVGMKDERGAHNALEDAKLEAECFSRLVYGKGLLKEYQTFSIPDYLR